jgi:hypothetical protein
MALDAWRSLSMVCLSLLHQRLSYGSSGTFVVVLSSLNTCINVLMFTMSHLTTIFVLHGILMSVMGLLCPIFDFFLNNV